MITDVLHWLGDPWSGAIMQRAFAEVVLLGVTGGAIGCWIVLNELSYGAESLPHAMFPGLVVAALAGAPLLVGGSAGLIAAALAIAAAARTPLIGRDSAIAVVVTGMFGLGVLLALAPATPQSVQSLLFGDILGVDRSDLIAAAILTVAVLAALRVLHVRLTIVSFDRTTSGSLGVPSGPLDVALLVLLALSVLIAVQALGNLLVVALLIAPAAAARLVTRRLVPMMATAAALAIVSGVAGLYVSYHLRTAAGASIALAMVAVYVIAAAAARIPSRRTA
ncbi:MAG TPA: metal ABC transporter permease [Thermoleophilaceae bacterium]|jgi:ABC-type Mn2+/Zn2+ transport system permease subunit|nr:metal ABC transporter permease [Thermoleophilaceae bacterium]